MNKKRTGIILGCIIAVIIVCFAAYNYWWASTRILIINPLPAQAADIALNNDCSHIRMKCIKMELGEPDASGRRRPIPVEGSEFVLDVDTVIMSLGTSPNPLIRSTTPGLETNKKGGIIVDENEMSTRENVFAGGDAVTGAATVILAMGAGKKAAEAIDRKLQAK